MIRVYRRKGRLDMRKYKIIVAGSRDFGDYELLKKELIQIITTKSVTENIEHFEIVSGTARGADTLGEKFAKEFGYFVKRFPADWNKLGKRAGYVRNAQMRDYADACICFWDGESKGTKHMIDLAIEKNLEVFVVQY